MPSRRYTVNEVEERTLVSASTLRQWERRYGFPKPARSDTGYRLYGESDIRDIGLMKHHIDGGMSASRAAGLVGHAENLLLQIAEEDVSSTLPGLQVALLQALLSLDETKANEIFSRAYSFHSPETVLTELAWEVSTRLGTLCARSTILVTTAHFGRSYIAGRVRLLYSTSPIVEAAPPVVVGCAPSEYDELDALIFVTLLRRAGYHTYFLGADTPIAALMEMSGLLRPTGIVLFASTAEAVKALLSAKPVFSVPFVGFGGAAFASHPKLADTLVGTRLEASPVAALRQFSDFIRAQALQAPNRAPCLVSARSCPYSAPPGRLQTM